MTNNGLRVLLPSGHMVQASETSASPNEPNATKFIFDSPYRRVRVKPDGTLYFNSQGQEIPCNVFDWKG